MAAIAHEPLRIVTRMHMKRCQGSFLGCLITMGRSTLACTKLALKLALLLFSLAVDGMDAQAVFMCGYFS
eukprot:scaffold32919_cov15-Tisochrysis_lutea.AAC.1